MIFMPSFGKSKYVQPLIFYKVLYKKFGPMGWWPVSRGRNVFPRYYKLEYSGKSAKEKFEICIGAILTQNTAWKNVEKAITNLNRAKTLTPAKICALSRGRLAVLIRPSGYYNQKAERLKGFARYVSRNYGGSVKKLFDKPPGTLRKELLSLKGVGPETADSMILYAADKPSFVVDAYTLRIGQRLGWFGQGTAYDAARKYISSRLTRSLKVYNEFHALTVAFGKDFCRKKPLCSACAFKTRCNYGREHQTGIRR
jgi:endonuclease III related protein